MDKLPVQPGTYALILRISDSHILDVGRLGRFEFQPGVYAYLGSACGPGGIRARLGRHLRGGGRPHWHIDYLMEVTDVRGYGYVASGGDDMGFIPTECEWSQVLASLAGAFVPVPEFGASDCNSGCPAHLIHFPSLDVKDQTFAILCHLNDYKRFDIK